MKLNWRYVRNGAVGLVEGVVLAVAPLEIAFPAACVLLCFWAVALVRSKSAQQRLGYLTQSGVAVLILAIAISLPVKALDARVGPMDYPPMPLRDLCERLGQDWGIHVRVGRWNDDDLCARQVAFRTDAPLSKRKMLQKLANDSGTNLRIGYCGTSESLLGGPYPYMIMLERRAGAKNGPARMGEEAR